MSLNSLLWSVWTSFVLTCFEMSFQGGVQFAVHAHVIWYHLSAGATAAILLIHRLSVGCLRLMHIILGTLCPPQSELPKGQKQSASHNWKSRPQLQLLYLEYSAPYQIKLCDLNILQLFHERVYCGRWSWSLQHGWTMIGPQPSSSCVVCMLMASCCASRARGGTNVARAQRGLGRNLWAQLQRLRKSDPDKRLKRLLQHLTTLSTVFQSQISSRCVMPTSNLISLSHTFLLLKAIFTGCLSWHLWPTGPLNPCWQVAHDENTLSIKLNGNFTIGAAIYDTGLL